MGEMQHDDWNDLTRKLECDHEAIRAGTAGLDSIGVQVGLTGEADDPDLELFNCPACGSTIAREVTEEMQTLAILRAAVGAPEEGWRTVELPTPPEPLRLLEDAEVAGDALGAYLEAGGSIVQNGYRLIITGTLALTKRTAARIFTGAAPEEI